MISASLYPYLDDLSDGGGIATPSIEGGSLFPKLAHVKENFIAIPVACVCTCDVLQQCPSM